MSEKLQGAQKDTFCDLSGTPRHNVLQRFLHMFAMERKRPKSGIMAKTFKNAVSERFGLSANVLISRDVDPWFVGCPKVLKTL